MSKVSNTDHRNVGTTRHSSVNAKQTSGDTQKQFESSQIGLNSPVKDKYVPKEPRLHRVLSKAYDVLSTGANRWQPRKETTETSKFPSSNDAKYGSRIPPEDNFLNNQFRRRIPETVTTNIASLTGTVVGNEAVPADEIEVTPEELKYERKLVGLTIKKSQFAASVPPDPSKKKWVRARPTQGTTASNGVATQAQTKQWQRGEMWSPDTNQLFNNPGASSPKSSDPEATPRIYHGGSHGRSPSSHHSVQSIAASKRATSGTVVKSVTIPSEGISLRELSSRLSMKVVDVGAKLLEIGEDVSKAGEDGELKLIDADTAELLVLELGMPVTRQKSTSALDNLGPSKSSALPLSPRAPVVCIMGHVDHGKTTLLDSLRKGKVAASEAGGITQKLSAFSVHTGGRPVVFLDTPGHAAFSSMRSNGAQATDVVVLVVAADDGVRPQTVEALRTAQQAGCAIIVAVNKVDKMAYSDRAQSRLRVLNQLLEHGIIAEDFGGETQVVEVSGKTGEGLDALIEKLLLQADLLELKAATEGQAEAIVLDANIERGRGVVANVLVKWGILKLGDDIVIGSIYGRVKAMINDKGESITEARPSCPVRLLGLRSVPGTGQELLSVSSEAKARQIAERRQRVEELRAAKEKLNVVSPAGSGLAPASSPGSEANAIATATPDSAVNDIVPVLNVLIKADGVGTLEALKRLVQSLGSRTKDVLVKVIGASVGDICRSDIELANTNVGAGALVLGFNVSLADSSTRSLAKEADIKISRDTVIYRLEDELRATMLGLMPKIRNLHPEVHRDLYF